MDTQTKINHMLELMDRPAFCVLGGRIISANSAAQSRLVPLGSPVAPLISVGSEEYAAFRQGCLYLCLTINGVCYDSSVSAVGDRHIFSLNCGTADQLRTLALAAQELREPLNRIMMISDHLPETLEADEHSSEMLARMNRGLYQILRMVSNMSDAGSRSQPRMELRDVPAVVQEVFAQASEYCAAAGVTLEYADFPASVYSLVDSQRLERCIYNILSNSLKYTYPGGVIRARLTRRGNTLYLTVSDSGHGLDRATSADPFGRFLREPGIEDGRHGLGLGLTLVRSTVLDHGGTVLLERSGDSGTRITVSLPIRQDLSEVKSPIIRIDYAGERNHALVELSDSLPYDLYRNK